MKGWLRGLLVLAMLLVVTGARAENNCLVIADFDSGVKPNNIGGDFGAWDKDPADFTQTCFESFSSTQRRGNSGFSLKLDYDVDSPNSAYNGFWMKLNGADFSKYKKLVIWIKGDSSKGYTKVAKLEFKNGKGEVGKYYISDIGDDWKEVTIPFLKIAGITDFSKMEELVLVFEDWRATKKEGSIYLDDINRVSTKLNLASSLLGGVNVNYLDEFDLVFIKVKCIKYRVLYS